MDLRTWSYAAHLAVLEHDSGQGMAVLPLPADDLAVSAEARALGDTLHQADWLAMVRHLAGIGWDVLLDDDGAVLLVGVDAEGRDVVGLGARECGTVDLDDLAAADAVLREVVSLAVLA